MDATQKMELFRELVRCSGDVYTWCYDPLGNLLGSNCPEEELLADAFSIFGCKERMLAHWKEMPDPITLGSGLGLQWSAAFEYQDGAPARAWVLGPYFYTDISMKTIENGFHAYLDVEVSVAWKVQFVKALYAVPTIPHLVSSQQLLMLHYCLTGEHLLASDIKSAAMISLAPRKASEPLHDRHKVWAAESALLQMVRTGDLDYRHALSASASLSNGVPVQGRDPLQNARISNIVFTSIVCRAAIEGGLSPEEGYSLGDAYIQSCVDARSIEELSAICGAMYDDFIRRVHKLRTNPKWSVPVQKCADYIEMHLGERIRAADLARIAGYGEYYLTQKFKEETGFSVNTYVKFAKMERAKVLLRGSDKPVQEIADALGFATRNHFSQSFKQVVGKTPAEYREEAGASQH